MASKKKAPTGKGSPVPTPYGATKEKKMLNSQLGDLAGGRSTRYGVLTAQEGIRGTGARSRVEQRRIDQTKRKKKGAR